MSIQTKVEKSFQQLYCPVMHGGQPLQSGNATGLYLYSTRCQHGLVAGAAIENCRFQQDKGTCWQIREGQVR
ncbi:MAG: hypothetical protein FWF34_02175 [Alphaproteobacteria bacterium]|nr:hypothetical protein [Alphaproteobacteria bacterium]MCL2890039.1 hypothetical protein [Alphaproteobacteria bacterium]